MGVGVGGGLLPGVAGGGAFLPDAVAAAGGVVGEDGHEAGFCAGPGKASFICRGCGHDGDQGGDIRGCLDGVVIKHQLFDFVNVAGEPAADGEAVAGAVGDDEVVAEVDAVGVA